MHKVFAAAVLAAAMFTAPAAPALAAPLPAKCALLWFTADCINAVSPGVSKAVAAPAAALTAAASPTIRLVRCTESTSGKALLDCTYE
ncbi:hypothetical protein SAMN02983003_0286 [Devosia enhydra]|uniref:Uncharacterized protein n=1 Tax=Devosia enhydra TaxID=665118 RepID=A0A1K2HSY9_9HYPH|nr:hypothetical protein [Devosia enhydra]SFZ81054.1 hypothetical protein SAMN02983003_0286 [Devosia enhydra]